MEQPRCVTEYYITPSLHTHGAQHSHTQRTASTCSLTQAPGGAIDTHNQAGLALGSALRAGGGGGTLPRSPGNCQWSSLRRDTGMRA